MKNIPGVLLFATVLVSCGKRAENKRPDVSYEMKTFRVESSTGCASDTLQCASYEVKYPEFSGLDSAVAKKIRREVDATVSMGNPEAVGKTMKQIGEEFVRDYEDFKKEMPDPESSGGWYYNAEVSVELVTDTLISLTVAEDYFTGGAHGGSGTYFINTNPTTGAEFTLDNLFKSGYLEPLTKAGDEIFRKVREIPDTASLNDNYFEFPDDKFQLNQNYGFRKDGIVFYYNNYEIAPYAAGPTEVLIPYDRIKEWIR
jgi:hypothetical protein